MDIISDGALSWIRQAAASGLSKPVPADEIEQFRAWMLPLCEDERLDVRVVCVIGIEKGLSSAVNFCGGSREAGRAVPPYYMNCLEDEHLPTKPDTTGIMVSAPRRRIRTRHHQLLGNAPSSQSPEPFGSKNILLLQLVSDRGVDFMFCDSGEIEFRITVEDLVAGRFDKVVATTCGS